MQPPRDTGLVPQLVSELGRAFDLSYAVGLRTLKEVVEERLRLLESSDAPEWGTEGSLTQLAKRESDALDFYYRPHLFPDMDPTLRLGHRLQFDLLPRHLPKECPLRLAAVLESYCHLSGDLVGWRLEDDELFLWILDVSGHGVRAGLAAATLYFLIDSIEQGLPPGDFAQRVNERMLTARNLDDSSALFATAVWLRAGGDGEIRYASCGHNPMLLLKSSGEIEELPSTGTPVGLLPDQTFKEKQFRLAEGDALCLFTDGLVEAGDPSGREFGTQRVGDLWRDRFESPLALTRSIYRAVREHQATRLFEDDLTIMVAQRSPGE